MIATENRVIPPARLDGSPSIDEREIVDVDFEHTNHFYRNHDRQECQHCGDAVELSQPHPRAVLWVDDSISRIMYKPVFCGVACWIDWMRTAEE